MPWRLTDSQKFLTLWILFLVGIVVGSHIIVSATLLGWLLVLWLMLLVSGQDDRVESVSVAALGFIGGLATWQLTGGETWVPSYIFGPIVGHIEAFRTTIVDRIFLALPEPHGSLLAGILIGNRAKLDPSLISTFRVVGLTHLIAVSGYNLSILTSNIQAGLWPILGRRSVFVSLLVIVAFVILSGAPASILRAAVMASALLVARYLGRPVRSLNLLVFAAGILAAFEPKIIFEIGFQLSVAATYGLVRFGPTVLRWLERFEHIPEAFRLILAETTAATLITAPILIIYFDRLSLVSPISNLLVLPLVPLLMGVGIVACFLLLVLPALGTLVVMLTWPLLTWVVWVSTKLAGWHYAATATTLPAWASLSILIAIVLLIEVLHHHTKSQDSEPLVALSKIRA